VFSVKIKGGGERERERVCVFVRTNGSVDSMKEPPLLVLFRVGLGVWPL
jgi:hypothetical protein